MLREDVEDEVEKLKVRKLELTNKINMTTSFDEKEGMKDEVDRIRKQIELLEKLKA